MNKHQVSVAAESFMAGTLAQAGYSVFVQYGANQPGFDIVATDMERSLMVSVKGSTDGGWFLTSKKSDGTYESALNEWIDDNRNMIFGLVQFKGVTVGSFPRMYIISGIELGEFLKTHYFGGISLSLYELYQPKNGKNKGKVMQIPAEWEISQRRIDEIFGKCSKKSSFK